MRSERAHFFRQSILPVLVLDHSTRAALFVLAALILGALLLAFVSLTNAILFSAALILAAALLLYPESAVYLLVFAVPFGSLLPLPVGNANVTAADVLLLGSWLLYLARGVARRELALRTPPLVLPFVIFILAAAVSITVARELTDSLSEWFKWIEMLAAYWLVANFLDERRGARLLAVMFVAGLSEALLGAYQYYFRVGPEGFLLFGGANLRAFGTFEQPNPYAGYLGLVIPLAFGAALGILRMGLGRERSPQRSDDGENAMANRVRNETAFVPSTAGRNATAGGNATAFVPYWLLASGSVAAMLAALFFSYSRGAWIGVAAALGVTALFTLVRSKRAAAVGLVLLLGALIVLGWGQINAVPDVIVQRFATVGDYFSFEDVRGVRANDENFALVERRAHWQAALGMFEDAPWLGVGFGNYAAAYPKYALPKWDDPLGHAHNYYLNVLAETGILGFGAFVILWGAIFWNAWRGLRAARGWTIGVAAGICGMLVALSIHNFFDNLFVHALYIQVGLSLGLGTVLPGADERAE
ncbi:MAG: O-antigen ligase family protein [Chloroflexi bacterium]|nr:O-antigen ligase family protein [Chloroflexota bacterium]